MKRRHLPPFLLSLFLLLLSSLSFRRRPPRPLAGGDLLRRLAVSDAGEAALLADASALLNASVSSHPGLGSHYNLIYLRLPPSPAGPNSSGHGRPRTVVRLRVPSVPSHPIPPDDVLLSAFRASVRSYLHERRQRTAPGDVAGVMRDLAGLLSRPLHLPASGGRRFRTCAVVGNSGVLLGAGRGAQIDAHDFVVRLNNARIAGYAADVGTKTSLSFINSNILHLCTRVAGCGCHPYGAAVPVAMYICQPAHLLDLLVCNASARAPPLVVTDARLDALCARIAKYYSLKRFVAETGSPAANWSKSHDEKYFHYSSGMQAVVLALGVCDQVSVFGFGKAPGAKHHYHTNQKKELDLHDYEAEYAFYRDLEAAPPRPAIPFLDEADGFRLPPVRFYREACLKDATKAMFVLLPHAPVSQFEALFVALLQRDNLSQ